MLSVVERTPRGAGAITVLTLEGEDVDRALSVLTGARGERNWAVGRIVLTELRLGEGAAVFDEALVVRTAPRCVELHLHGSPPLVRELRQFLAAEFESPDRDLALELEDRARFAVGFAASEAGARMLLDQAAGALRRELESLESKSLAEGVRVLDALLERARRARFALRPAHVVLAGPVNAGKSTLFNALLGEERALVSDVEGTTRDLLSQRASFAGWPVQLADGAGERELEDASRGFDGLEAEGQALVRAARRFADLCVWLQPSDAASEGAPDPESSRVISIPTRGDLVPGAIERGSISVVADAAGAVQRVVHEFERALGLNRPIWRSGEAVPFEQEQWALLERARAATGLEERNALIRELLLPRVASSEGLR